MALEDLMAENTAAVNRLTAAILGKVTPQAIPSTATTTPAANGAAEAGKRGPGRPAGSTKPSGTTFDEVIAIAKRVMDEKSKDAAVDLIKAHGADKLLQLDKSRYAEFVAAATVLLNKGDELEPEPDYEGL